ncbi:hypothetical protein BKA63DRAFT_399897 [Paraphoma chrysanthemicola]|nr:hypothetical protein BKA63DRAFT_399897 [Paraphoma chrysanthemicola]
MHIPTTWRALWYLVVLAALTLATVLYSIRWSHGLVLKDHGFGHIKPWRKPGHRGNTSESTTKPDGKELPDGLHPISHLLDVATIAFETTMKNQAQTLDQAAAMYRKKRGRHPPPGFDAWYAYAASHKALIVESFWDQIYDDLGPFWTLDPVLLRKQAHVLSPRIEVRDQNAAVKAHTNHAKLDAWVDMMRTLSQSPKVELPDMDIPLSTSSSAAMLVPWETIDTAMSMSRKMMAEPRDVVSAYSGLADIEALTADYEWKPKWLGPRLTHPESWLGPRPLWSVARLACPPGSPARQAKVFNDIWTPKANANEAHSATALLPLDLPKDSLKGYANNWTLTTEACQHPNLQGLHSDIVSPVEMAISNTLFPLFAGSKIAVGNEILLPAVADWNTSAASEVVDWKLRHDTLHYRSTSTLANEPARYWRRFQRERLLSVLNATHVEIAEASVHSGNESTVGVGYASNFRVLPANEYHLKAQTGGQLAEWVNGWADAGLTELTCGEQEGGCGDMAEYYSTVGPTPPDGEKSKYAVAIDDDSLLHHLRSAKVTLRSTIQRHWYDSRLVPWLHFIPLHHSFVDLYGVMEYFIGSSVREGRHDDAARKIAEMSKVWADKVLREEDMLIYTYRLLLEYARVVDDKRDRLGWIRDLK